MLTTTTSPDIPTGWAQPALPCTFPAPAFDTTPRLIPGARASSELVQLCGRWSPELHPADALAEPKIDGHRALFYGGGNDLIITREGSPMGCAAHCLPALRQLEARYGEPMVFDAEFAVPGGLKETLRAFRRNRPEPTGVMWLFDALPLREWSRGGTDQPLGDRKVALARNFGDGLCASVGRVLSFAMGAEAVQILARGFWARGFEGVVVKDRTAGYWRGRNDAFLKLKQGD